jgi:hypothetical protein
VYDAIVDASWIADYTTIQAALAAGKKRIFVRSWTYVETYSSQVNLTWSDYVIHGGGLVERQMIIDFVVPSFQWVIDLNPIVWPQTQFGINVRWITLKLVVNPWVPRIAPFSVTSTDPTFDYLLIEDCYYQVNDLWTWAIDLDLCPQTADTIERHNYYNNCRIWYSAGSTNLVWDVTLSASSYVWLEDCSTEWTWSRTWDFRVILVQATENSNCSYTVRNSNPLWGVFGSIISIDNTSNCVINTERILMLDVFKKWHVNTNVNILSAANPTVVSLLTW